MKKKPPKKQGRSVWTGAVLSSQSGGAEIWEDRGRSGKACGSSHAYGTCCIRLNVHRAAEAGSGHLRQGKGDSFVSIELLKHFNRRKFQANSLFHAAFKCIDALSSYITLRNECQLCWLTLGSPSARQRLWEAASRGALAGRTGFPQRAGERRC